RSNFQSDHPGSGAVFGVPGRAGAERARLRQPQALGRSIDRRSTARGLSGLDYSSRPPSITSVCPVTNEDAALAKYTTAPAISSGAAIRCSAAASSDDLRNFGSSQSARANSVFTSPGAMQLTRMLSLPQVFACTCVSMITAAFDTE